MRISILGAGAMGMLFGGYLSQRNDVWLIDVNKDRITKINSDGVAVRETDGDMIFYPRAAEESESLGKMDLILVFVKAMYTCSALEANRCLIGPDTYLMSLQNGVGHEVKLLRFSDRDHVIIGSTQHNSSIIDNGHVNHGGRGKTFIGLLDGHSDRLRSIAKNFSACGFDCATSDEVKEQIWRKLFLNTSASVLTAMLQVPLGFILDDPYAGSLMEKLAREAVAVANAEGIASFDVDCIVADIKELLTNAKDGYTSIYADVKNGTYTEVDTISGSVVDAAKRLDVPVPFHEMAVSLIHAMENKNRNHIN
ncbi:MAG: 2-dehydropantoate 2-reductase [Firmicutes bacterium ADurb.Bin248]|nr:MAG: 2-dehydropantoate 2-reductase [Firmicutes bacterium ADurb.Bin248]HOG02075.1 2-dehydropantoate 2-reductase [Clostridia bacterium]HPK15873.1 2-dehydropantoate 2-reductase [Clostridia bacterium]